jgi:hypothetical protein
MIVKTFGNEKTCQFARFGFGVESILNNMMKFCLSIIQKFFLPSTFTKESEFSSVLSILRHQRQAHMAWGNQGVEDGCRPPALQAGHPRNSHMAVLGMAYPQDIRGSGLAGAGKTSGSPWIPLPIRA